MAIDHDLWTESGLNRREFLRRGAIVGAGGLALGGLAWGRHAHAVNHLEQTLLAQAAPVTTATAHTELSSLPSRGREQIRLFFDGLCLDVHEFTSRVCSQPFTERLAACSSDEERHRLMSVAFEQRVVTADAVLNRVRVIAEELGAELDRNWRRCCIEIAKAWGVSLREYDAALSPDRLAASVEPQIRASIDEVLQTTETMVSRPAFGDVPLQIGAASLLLVPMLPYAPKLVLPVFVAVALRHIMAPIIGWLLGPDAGDLHHDVSTRVQEIGMRVGSEFELEIRRRIADLQTWRDESLRSVARARAEVAVGWF